MNFLQMDELTPLEKCIKDTNKTHKVLNKGSIEFLEEVATIKDFKKKPYNDYFRNIDQRLEKAEFIIAKYESKDYKKELANLLQKHIDFFLAENNEIKTVAVRARDHINAIRINPTLGELSASLIRQRNSFKLTPQHKFVMNQYLPEKGGKNKNRKTKKQHRKINKRLTL